MFASVSEILGLWWKLSQYLTEQDQQRIERAWHCVSGAPTLDLSTNNVGNHDVVSALLESPRLKELRRA